jgi:hypothetical protein
LAAEDILRDIKKKICEKENFLLEIMKIKEAISKEKRKDMK